MSKFSRLALFLASGLAVAASQGAVPVVDLNAPGASQPATTRPAPARPSGNPTADLHYQLQMIQEELRNLRGMVEEQANEIRQIKQRQMDDYLDLDRRLSGGYGAAGAGVAAAAAGAASNAGGAAAGAASEAPVSGKVSLGSFGAAAATATSAADEEAQLQDYSRAYNLLKARKIDEAIKAFEGHIASYPQGSYAANSHYWLGEIYLLRNDLPRAEAAFAEVVDNFPAHRKAGDAAYKLGTVYHLQGKNDQARAILKKVSDGTSSAAALAHAYLRDNLK